MALVRICLTPNPRDKPSALPNEKEKLYGTWRLVSDVRKDVETGAMTDNFGKHPQGFLSYGRDGRMSAIEVAEQRPKPTDLSKMDDSVRAALFRTMLAYGGTFSFDGKVVTHHVDISWNNNWTGSDQIRNVRLEGNRLYITTNVQPSPIDGKLSIGILTWEKVE
jgi:Lipocalin-like domain